MGLCLPILSCQPAPTASGNEVQGVWERREITRVQAGEETVDTNPGPSLYIFTRTHYSIVLLRSADAPSSFATRWSPSDDEKIARYDAVAVNSGTYEIADGSLVTRPVIARVADFVGGEARYEYRVSGDTLWLRMVEELSFDGVPAPWLQTRRTQSKLVRVE
jgi:hypothetical protein